MDAQTVFEILVRENTPMLLAFLRSAVRQSATVDDLFQETMLVAWRRIDEFDRHRPFGPWLRGIAAKLLLSHYRRSSRQELSFDEHSLDWISDRIEQIQSLPGDQLAEKLDALKDCVAHLPDHYRQPIELRYRDALGLNELAKMMHLSMDLLKKRLWRAKGLLAECVQRKITLAQEG